MKELDNLEWYVSIYIEDEEGNYTELLSKEDYDSYDEKEIIYEVNYKKMDTSWDNVQRIQRQEVVITWEQITI